MSVLLRAIVRQRREERALAARGSIGGSRAFAASALLCESRALVALPPQDRQLLALLYAALARERAFLPERFEQRFAAAFDTEFQGWVNRLREGLPPNGPSAWDGYAAAACCEAGVEAQMTGNTVMVDLGDKPTFYG